MSKTFGCYALAAVLGLGALASPARADAEGYHDFAAVEARLQGWAREHAKTVDLETIGQSAGGRGIHVVRLAADGPLPADERPAVFVGANIAGFHNAGTEAALHLIERLLAGDGDLSQTTYFVAPVLNPDAHDGLFADLKMLRGGADGKLDRDVDGLLAEDGPNDLDGDGRITRMRIPDPAGGWLPHPEDDRVMVRANAEKGWIGTHRVETEGGDDDGDGKFNEDGPFGVVPDMNFAHGWPFPKPEAGPWPSFAPESQAIMDFLLARRNVALAVVYGPGNNFLAAPQSFGGGGDLGTQKFKVPPQIAEFIGLDPEVEYTLDEVWEVVQDMPFVRQNGVTKEQLGQFLGAGPATKVADGDLKAINAFADDYKKRLEEAELGKDRPAEQYSRGGFTPWLYYQYGVMAVELDVWGIPKAKKEEAEEEGDGEVELSIDSLKEMSSEDFLALGKERVAAFLEEIGAPAQITADMVIQRVEAGQITPPQMAQMMAQMGGGGGGGGSDDPAEDDPQTQRRREVLAWAEANAADAITPWSQVTLKDGTVAEVGGLDPYLAVAPPRAILEPALAVHTATVLDMASKLARIEIHSFTVDDLGQGIYRVEAMAANRGELPTHSEQGVRAQTHLPIRLELITGDRASLVTGTSAAAEPKLDGRTGTLEKSWLIRAEKDAEIEVRLTSNNAGRDEETAVIGKGTSR